MGAATFQKRFSTRSNMATAAQPKHRSATPDSKRQSGQGLVEYAFILVLVSLVVIVALVSSGRQVVLLYSNITGTLHSAGI